MTFKPEPLFLLNSEGEKIAVMLKLEEYEQLMQRLETLESSNSPGGHQKVQAEVITKQPSAPETNKLKPRRSKLIFKKTEAEKAFENSDSITEIDPEDTALNIRPNNFYTKSVIHNPVSFEMEDEFCSAKGMLMPDGKSFKVLAGSKASGIADKRLPKKIESLREELIMLQVLTKDTEHGDLLFSRDYVFDDPDDAASTIAAATREGKRSWISTETGKPMRQY